MRERGRQGGREARTAGRGFAAEPGVPTEGRAAQATPHRPPLEGRTRAGPEDPGTRPDPAYSTLHQSPSACWVHAAPPLSTQRRGGRDDGTAAGRDRADLSPSSRGRGSSQGPGRTPPSRSAPAGAREWRRRHLAAGGPGRGPGGACPDSGSVSMELTSNSTPPACRVGRVPHGAGRAGRGGRGRGLRGGERTKFCSMMAGEWRRLLGGGVAGSAGSNRPQTLPAGTPLRAQARKLSNPP